MSGIPNPTSFVIEPKFFSKLKLKDITQADIEQFLDHLFSADKCQMRTVKDIKVLFNGIMEQAVKDGLIADNPVKDAMINKSLALRNAKVKDDDDFFEPNRRPVGDSLPSLSTTIKTASCQGGLFCLLSSCF